MDLLAKDLRDLNSSDIARICTDQIVESATLEFKADLPCNDGKRKDPWHQGGRFSDYARNSLAREIVAFANTFGGALVLGVNETKDKPSRAASPNPLPRVHDLERSLRQALQDTIDPPLPILESTSIALDDHGNGVIVFRVPTSRRRPHRVDASREAFVRRMDESVRVGMREIQELTIQNLSEVRRVEDTIAAARHTFISQLHNWRDRPNVSHVCGLHFVAIPISPVDLGRVTGRPDLTDMRGDFVAADSEGNQYNIVWPMDAASPWTPGLRRISATSGESPTSDARCRYSLNTNGVCELAFLTSMPGLFAGWLAGALCKMLFWIDNVRREAGVPGMEYALAPQIAVVNGPPALLMRYGSRNFDSFDGVAIPEGLAEFPIMSVGGADEFPKHLMRFDEDCWNLVGHDFQQSPIRFELKRP